MEGILECYFDKVFSDLERDNLYPRYRRKSLVEYFSTLIEGCSKGFNEDTENICKKVVQAAIQYHEKNLASNGSVCLMGKHHNILYVALKLCFDFKLRDSETVSSLLNNIYSCERTFERLFLGAIFGTTVPFFVAGWKSDFKDREENVKALVYFLHHATTAKLEYLEFADKPIRFVDVPIESCGRCPPVKVVLQIGTPDLLHILVRFGAEVSSEDAEYLMYKLNENEEFYPFNLVACLKIVLRAIPNIKIERIVGDGGGDEISPYESFFETYSHMFGDLVPLSRCGCDAVELKHLCRCSVREILRKNYQLPNGINQLSIPESLRNYLNLQLD